MTWIPQKQGKSRGIFGDSMHWAAQEIFERQLHGTVGVYDFLEIPSLIKTWKLTE